MVAAPSRAGRVIATLAALALAVPAFSASTQALAAPEIAGVAAGARVEAGAGDAAGGPVRPTIPPDAPAASPARPPSLTVRPAAVAVPGAAAKAAKPAPPPEPIRIADDPRPTLSPETFVATMKAAESYRAIVEAGGWPTVANDATRLRPGEGGPTVAALGARLLATGDLPEREGTGTTFDEGLAAGIRRFQARHGLEETGIVGPRTLVHLNIPASTRLRQLQGSAGRLIGSKFPFGDRYVVVNIPSAAVEAVDHGRVARRHVAVVGKPDRASPQIETRITSVNFNPTWTVPTSLIRKDIIPHVRKDPNYLAKMRIRLFDAAGQEVDPGTIDWSTERAVNYTVRQDAGVANSLGEVRIDMPNRHAVYMHDTPSKRLFANASRAQSSGCVRVSGVKDLIAWLLEGTAGPAGPGSRWGAPEIDAAIAGGRRIDARLARAVPVAWVYLTGYATADGAVQFREDVYALDDAPAAPAALTIEALVTSSVAPSRPALER